MGCIMFIGTPRGAFTSILYLFLELPPRVFLGILSEYCTHKYSPELVNKDFGDFLVTGYIVYRHPPVAHAWGITKFFLYIFMQPFRASLNIPRKSQSLQTFFLLLFLKVEFFFNYNLGKNYLTLGEARGVVGFCTNTPLC